MSQPALPRIAFLGLGLMGQAMVRRLLASGYPVTVWNRTLSAATPLAAEGATVVAEPAEAARGCDLLFTMLFDDAAYEQTLFGASGALGALPPDALHIACGTISVALSARLAAEHARRGQQYVAAPVFGRPNVAAEGRLWIVAAGDADALDRARPALAALSRGVSIAGSQPAQAHGVKLAGNFMINLMIQAMSEAVVFAEGQGIDPETMLDTINSALFQSPFYSAYARLLLHPPHPPGATLALGIKDATLFLEAAESTGLRPEVAALIAARLRAAVGAGPGSGPGAGLGSADWASGMLTAARHAATLKA